MNDDNSIFVFKLSAFGAEIFNKNRTYWNTLILHHNARVNYKEGDVICTQFWIMIQNISEILPPNNYNLFLDIHPYFYEGKIKNEKNKMLILPRRIGLV